ncbi:hypothetical protein [Actinopolymorpha pittospori]|uniref:Uncharacterized protein n=1 Tax=Actinopolymorpha pittospori TaxID=648752 RepID=A0A927N5F3_9ACTN|nr:hypothetical protein [Actinopolymorpha pittospori]MBE1608860.1 hypothetical protein [Actinopolymorpha pittospori]
MIGPETSPGPTIDPSLRDSARRRIEATLHCSPRGPVSDVVRLQATDLLAGWWAAAAACEVSDDDLRVVVSLPSVALDVAQSMQRRRELETSLVPPLGHP